MKAIVILVPFVKITKRLILPLELCKNPHVANKEFAGNKTGRTAFGKCQMIMNLVRDQIVRKTSLILKASFFSGPLSLLFPTPP